MTHITTAFQSLYDVLLKLANHSFEYSKHATGMNDYWLGKSEGYESAMQLISDGCNNVGCSFETILTERQKELMQYRHEEQIAEAYNNEKPDHD